MTNPRGVTEVARRRITCGRRVTNFQAELNAFGQMTGTFEYFYRGNHSGAYEYTVRVELVDVMRRR